MQSAPASPVRCRGAATWALFRVSPEETAWQQALEQNRMEAYWTYLKAWPEGTHVAEARAMLDRLRPPPPPAYQEPGK